MGKIKNKRRLHNKAAKVVTKAEKPVDAPPANPQKAPSLSGISALFKGVKVNPEYLKAQLAAFDNDDAKSTITSKSFRGLNIKKKDKQKIKHEVWLHKMDTLNQAKKEAKESKKRQQTVIVKDMKPLEDTLPTLELLLKENFKGKSDKSEEEKRPKSVKKMKTRQKEMNESINLFKQVINHPAYKENPFGTITEHLRNKLKQEEEDMVS